MIDINEEHLITIADAARLVPRRPHASTVYRWISRGIRGVRLESLQVGGVTYTSREAVQRFGVRLSRDHQPSSPSVSQDREKEIARELAESGLR